ncbi:MAG: hypothetical protein H6819_12455 [Phycisphaerales bacterium]|nr:hypothetical protein [Phycisphaerales bacterium]MCB9855192.1 hypothetical protein [Phycisphaerales bacterium]MCB9862785.1 hypothetical protein [Phycisphaerales bacterium]
MRRLAVSSAASLMLASWATTVSAAAITVYTDKLEWENAIGGQFVTEDFADDELDAGVSFVSSESGHINPALECYQDVLASQSQNEPMTTWSFVPEIKGYGGNWTLGGPGGSGNSLLVYVGDPPVFVGAISNNYNGGFWGFTSDTPFATVKLIGGGGTNQQNYCLDDMVYSDCQAFTKGDMNCDAVVDSADIPLFVEALLNPAVYDAAHPCCSSEQADMDGTGTPDGNDVASFVDAIFGS